MAKSHDVCIRGGGIVGRTLALLLARQGLRVGLVTRAPANAADVRAYALNSTSRALLTALRVWPDAVAATPVETMQVHGDQGGLVTFSAAEQGCAALTWIVDVPALEARLSDAIAYQPLVDLLDAPAPAALTVICEGRASVGRDALAVEFNVRHYPHHAVAARLRCDRAHGQIARQWFAKGDAGSEILAFLPMGGVQGNLIAIVWSVPEERAKALMALEPQAFAAAVQAAGAGELGGMELVSERAVWPLQIASASRWVGDGFALAGDAAHNVHPLSGQGLNLGLADVAALATVLRGKEAWRSLGDVRLLRRYERARKADVAAMQATTDGLQQLFAFTDARWQTLRNWGMNGFEKSGPLKAWLVRQAMGQEAIHL